jgi:hypothetical protein
MSHPPEPSILFASRPQLPGLALLEAPAVHRKSLADGVPLFPSTGGGAASVAVVVPARPRPGPDRRPKPRRPPTQPAASSLPDRSGRLTCRRSSFRSSMPGRCRPNLASKEPSSPSSSSSSRRSTATGGGPATSLLPNSRPRSPRSRRR